MGAARQKGWLLGTLGVLVAGSMVAVAAARQPAVRSLSELTEAALRRNPGIAATAHALDAAEAKLREAKFSPYMQFNAIGAFGIKPNQRGTPTFTPESNQLPLLNPWRPWLAVGVEGYLPLYTFGKLQGGRDAARAGVRAAQHSRGTVLAQVRWDVRRAYYALQLALDAEQLIQEGHGKLQDAIETLDERLEDDDAEVDEMDRYRLATVLAEVDSRSSEVMRAKASSREALRLLTGLRQIEVADCPLQRLPWRPQSQSSYQTMALRDRPELHTLQAALGAQQALVRLHRARYFPDLALGLEAFRSYSPGTTDQLNPFIYDVANYAILRAGIYARWSLDLVGSASRLSHAQAQLEENKSKADLARTGLAIEVSATYQKVADAERRERTWSQGAKQARAWFIASLQGHQIGTQSSKDLIEALKAYFGARFNHIEAIFDFNVALAELEKVTGRPVLHAKEWEPDCEAG